ncbi:MAG: aldehyde dehydrogenase (NADP(+)) [Pseudomonadota bacterium]
MDISSDSLIGHARVPGTGPVFHALAAATGEPLQPAFSSAGTAQVDQACELARRAFDEFRCRPLEQRAALLEAIAQGLIDLGPALIERAMLETGLPAARLQGECNRTVVQLRLFADVARQGSWLNATLDSAQPQRQPLPRPDLRMGKIALGPVAVFGASNFPLAFSVAGGDTASALAAGCPVIVKAHPAHPGTSAMVGAMMQRVVAEQGLPEGVFSLLLGAGTELGAALVSHPAIAAVGFTGSRHGGLALIALAQQRPEPIPVYAEMSAINPVLLLPAALANRADSIARAFADSLTLGAGQFCTNPGLVIAIEGDTLARFEREAALALSERGAATMLTPGIHAAYQDGVQAHSEVDGVTLLARGRNDPDLPYSACAALFATSAQTFLQRPALAGEVFGPAAVIVRCRDAGEMRDVLEHLEGQLTATLQLDEADHALAAELMPVLERKAGRILANGFPTGVEVTHAMVHGGPSPATSDARSTSVGSAAIERFLRPVCYQDIPQALLPAALRDGNPLGLWRVCDGAPGRA